MNNNSTYLTKFKGFNFIKQEKVNNIIHTYLKKN